VTTNELVKHATSGQAQDLQYLQHDKPQARRRLCYAISLTRDKRSAFMH
jgi:hypothetical protein